MNHDEVPARGANIFDVARLAGVSHQTVSRVVNGHPNVRDSTRTRVEDAIRQLRYRPNTAARALVSRRSRTLGLIMTGSPDYGPSNIVFGFNEAARNARYNVSIASTLESDDASIRSSVEMLLGQNAEAIVLVAAHRKALEVMHGIGLGVPIIAVESSGRLGFHSVAIDQFAGARAATEHLIGLGHRRIAHISGPLDSMDAQERVAGWRAALADHQLLSVGPLVGDWSPTSGYECGSILPADVTAVFVSNDQMAIGVVFALAERGIRVPQDVSVIGFDDIPEGAFVTPPLTTVRQDFAALGRDILGTVMAVLGDDPPGSLPRRVPEVVIRSSTAPPATVPTDHSSPRLDRRSVDDGVRPV